jgi:nucleoside-diphosphate-sugar epimerase
MVYLITGCNGFIGGYIARHLLVQGHTVKGLKRNGSKPGSMEGSPGDFSWVEGDLLDLFSLENALDGVDRVVHAAGYISFLPEEGKKMLKVNVEGTANLVNACLRRPSVVFCHVSSVAALGEPDVQSQWVNETAKWENGLRRSRYAVSKFLAEQEVWRGFEEGLNGFIVSPSVVLGQGDWHKGSLQVIGYVQKGSKWYPDGRMNFVDVRDVARVIGLLFDKGAQHERFILNAGSVSYRELMQAVAKELQVAPPEKMLAMPQAKRLVWLIKLKNLFSRKKVPITKDLVYSIFNKVTYQNNKVVKELGYQFQELSDTLQWACKPRV